MKKVLATAAFLSVGILQADIPVMIDSGGEDLDPCSLAEVRGLDPRGDGFLAVRGEPNGNGAIRDKLHNGDKVWYCDEAGKWVGIVYGKNCGVSSPVNPPKPYSGSCKSGWVFGKWVTVIAG